MQSSSPIDMDIQNTIPLDQQALNEELQNLLNDFRNMPVDQAMNLVRAGANPDTVNSGGDCLLHFLVMHNHEGHYDLLIEELVVKHHANLNIPNKRNKPPILYCGTTDLNTIELLIQLGAKDSKGNPLLR